MIDYKIEMNRGMAEMKYENADGIFNNIYLSLHVQKGSFFAAPDFGSRLHEIKKLTEQNIALAKDYCKEACQWIIDLGRATSIDIIVERDEDVMNRMNILVTAVQANGAEMSFTTFVEVV